MGSVDDVMEALRHEHRRRLLIDLMERDPETGLPIKERDVLTEQESTSYDIELHHVHLPRLKDKGFIEWDRDAATITRGPAFDEVRTVLQPLLADDDVDKLR